MTNTLAEVKLCNFSEIYKLPVVRLHFYASTMAPLTWPHYAGSMLRGAFGHALKKMALLPHKNDQICALQASCPYCQVFNPQPQPGQTLPYATSHLPPPYCIETPVYPQARILPANTPFEFALILVGKGCDYLPAIIMAFECALKHGLGKSHAPCKLLNVYYQNQPVTTASTIPSDKRHVHKPESKSHQCSLVKLHWHTPLRLQQQGRPATSQTLTARSLLISLARRWQFLANIHLSPNPPRLDFDTIGLHAAQIELDTSKLVWYDWQRYSNRQKQYMKLGGLIGEVALKGNIEPFMDLLYMGQWLHAGKETTFGFGQYTIKDKT